MTGFCGRSRFPLHSVNSSSTIDKKLENRLEIDKKTLKNRLEIFEIFVHFEFILEIFVNFKFYFEFYVNFEFFVNGR